MIEKINETNLISNFYRDDIFYVRIMSLMKAYGFEYDFAVFYRQVLNNAVTAVISKLDGDFTVCANDDADFAEIEEFCKIIGYNSLLCDDRLLSERHFTFGHIMQSVKKVELHKNYTEIDKYPKLMELFNFLDYSSADFESWYVDVSHRIRHGCACAYSLNFDKQIVSSAMLSSIFNDRAILSAVRTEDEYRGLGFGSTLVSEIICDFNGKVYLMRDEDKNEQFYKRLGFENCGNWRMYK